MRMVWMKDVILASATPSVGTHRSEVQVACRIVLLSTAFLVGGGQNRSKGIVKRKGRVDIDGIGDIQVEIIDGERPAHLLRHHAIISFVQGRAYRSSTYAAQKTRRLIRNARAVIDPLGSKMLVRCRPSSMAMRIAIPVICHRLMSDAG